MSAQQLRALLALWQAPGFGSVTIARIRQQLPELSELWRLTDAERRAVGLSSSQCKSLQAIDWKRVDAEMCWAEQPDQHIISEGSPHFSRLLSECHDAPPLLYVKGDLTCLQQPQLAIVGSRNPTPQGRANAEQFATCLVRSGLTVTSGLALGIDAASHQGALAGGGQTIAVVATGLDQLYPSKHQALASAIADSGAVVTEFPLGTLPRPGYFPRRNRIISGLSVGVLVVEAALQSGSLITAKQAIEQGREVFAIPGSIHNPLSRGCHALIRQGAKLVEQASDIIEELSSLLEFCQPSPNITNKPHLSDSLDVDQQKLIKCLSGETLSIEQLIDLTGFCPEKLAVMLVELELSQQLQRVGGSYTKVN